MATTETPPEQEAGTETETLIIDSDELADSEIDKLFAPKTVTVETAVEDTGEQEETTEEEAESTTEEEKEETEESEKTEATEEVEEEAAETTEEDPKKSKKLTEENLQGILDDRIKRLEGKLRAEHKKALDDIQNEKEKLNKPTSAIEMVRDTWSHETIDKLESDAEEIIDFVADHPEGYTANEGSDKERFMDVKELRAMSKIARTTQKEIRSRRKLIDESEQHNTQMHQAFPALLEDDSELNAAVNRVYEKVPGIKNQPDRLYMAIALIKGDQLLSEDPKEAKAIKKAIKKVKTLPVKAPSLGNPSEKGSVSSTKKEAIPKSVMDALATGDEDAVDDLLNTLFPA